MPKIQLIGNELDSQYLHSLMVYPNDSLERDKLFAVCGTSYANENPSNSVLISPELIKLLLNSDSLQTISRNASLQAASGQIAGDVLIYLARMKLSNHCEPSLNKAYRLTTRKYASARNSEKINAPASKPKIKEIFKSFLPVVHLWAAYNICQIPNTVNYIPCFDIHEPKNLVTFLGVADWFSNFTENFISSRQATKNQKPVAIVDNNILYHIEINEEIHEPDVTWNFLEVWMTQELNLYSSSS